MFPEYDPGKFCEVALKYIDSSAYWTTFRIVHFYLLNFW